MGQVLIAAALLMVAAAAAYLFAFSDLALGEALAVMVAVMLPLGAQVAFGVLMLRRAGHDDSPSN